MRGLRTFLPMLVIAMLAVCTTTAAGDPPRREGTPVRGRVLRISGDSFLVQVEGGKQVTLHSGPKTVYRYRDRDGRFNDIRAGMSIRAIYDVSQERNLVSSVILEDADRDAPAGQEAANIRGRIVKANSDPNHLVILTTDGKELILYLDSQRESTFRYETREGKRVLTGLSLGLVREGPAPAATAPISGTIVRVAGADRQFVVRTEAGREVIFYAEPKAVYEFDGREVEFTTLRPGVSVSVNYDVRDQKHYARKISGRKR
jgi:hypothetical protein